MRLSIEGYFRLSSDDRAAICEWLADHGIDPCDCFAVRIEGEGPVVAECDIDVPFTARRLPDARIMADWLRFEAMAVAS